MSAPDSPDECSSLAAGTAQGECFAFFINEADDNINTFWLIFSGSLVFFMQAGFAMLCAGSIRSINIKNIMLKNLLDACGGAIGYWSLGYAFAYGSENNSFIGSSNFFLGSVKDYTSGYDLAFFFFQWAFAATAATIVAGTVAERCKMVAYFVYSFALTAFVYPIVTRAVWAPQGWLGAFRTNGPSTTWCTTSQQEMGLCISGSFANNNDGFYPSRLFGPGMIDFAGSGVVHLTGGTTAIVAAVILGPRIGRFKDEHGVKLVSPNNMPAHSVILQVLGTFILWFGWYGFNPGSTLIQSTASSSYVAALAAVNTTLSAASGALASFALRWALSDSGLLDVTALTNGALSGLVAITAGCAVVWPWAAVVVGMFGGFLYIGFSNLLIKLRIDDAVDAIPVHFANGIWGCISVGLFASNTLVQKAYSYPTNSYAGWFYEWSAGCNRCGNGSLLAAQLVGVIFIIGWTVCLTTPLFWTLNQFGLFRVPKEEEQVGLDISHHGGSAVQLTKPTEEALAAHMRKSSTHHNPTPPPQAQEPQIAKVVEIEEDDAV